MTRIGIYINTDKNESINLALNALNTLKEYDVEPVLLSRQIDENIIPDIKRLPIDEFFNDSSTIIVFGGDGTLLSVARRAAPYGTPLFGINAGKLGFLTEGEAVSSRDLIKELMSGNVISDNRILLNCKVYLSGGREIEFLALNDVVIKNTALRLMYINVDSNDHLLENFRADGLIISTPTGSTAYSLAASGPIVHPSSHVLIINPICPQNLNNRPFIVPDNIPLRISFDKTEHNILVSMDGQDNISLNGTDFLEITVSKYKTKLLRLKDSSYYERIRSKLYDIR